MCLAAFAINTSSRWPLVLASNRDEFFDRPALPLAAWQTASGHAIFAGRDQQAGGSWLGVGISGRVALLTNVREALPQAQQASRGELVIDWLSHAGDALSFAAQKKPTCYGGFNLVLGDLHSGQWHIWGNRPTDLPPKLPRALTDGVYGLSNAALDTPWPKTVALKAALHAALQAPSQAELERQLRLALNNSARASTHALPDTGVPQLLEHGLSSAHVSLPERNYGTRCASVLVVSAPRNQAGKSANLGTAYFSESSFLMTPGGTQPAGAAVQLSFSVPLLARHTSR